MFPFLKRLPMDYLEELIEQKLFEIIQLKKDKLINIETLESNDDAHVHLLLNGKVFLN